MRKGWNIDHFESATGQDLDSELLPVPLSHLALSRDTLVSIVAGGYGRQSSEALRHWALRRGGSFLVPALLPG